MPRSSAIRAILRQSGQVACQRSGTNVAVRAEEQFAPNRPIFKVFLLYISMRWDIDPGSVRAARAAFGTASDSLSSNSVRFCAKARPLSMIARGTTRHDHPILGAWRLDRRRAPQATARRLEDYPGGGKPATRQTASRRTPKRTFPRLIRFVQNPIESITDKEMRFSLSVRRWRLCPR